MSATSVRPITDDSHVEQPIATANGFVILGRRPASSSH